MVVGGLVRVDKVVIGVGFGRQVNSQITWGVPPRNWGFIIGAFVYVPGLG